MQNFFFCLFTRDANESRGCGNKLNRKDIHPSSPTKKMERKDIDTSTH